MPPSPHAKKPKKHQLSCSLSTGYSAKANCAWPAEGLDLHYNRIDTDVARR